MRLSELPPEFREPVIKAEVPRADMFMSADEEIAAICQVLEQSNGKVTHAARMLGMSRATFWRKRKKYKL